MRIGIKAAVAPLLIALLIALFAANACAQAAGLEAGAANAQAEKPNAYFVYATGCEACSALEPFIDGLERQYAGRVEFVRYELFEHSEQVMELQQQHGVPVEKWGSVPKVFVNGYYCEGVRICTAELELEMEKALQGSGHATNAGPVQVSPLHMVGLALVDAINPCELAVLVILLTAILVRYPERRRKVLYAGLAFSFAIFLAYIIMGMLIIFGFKSIAAVTQLNTLWLYRALGVLAIALGILNVKDYVKFGAGGFAIEVPESWRPKMRGLINKTTSVPGAFVAGLIVSLFLTPCTAGPYFVAGGILAGVGWITAVLWLLLYNIIFIAPMIGITLAVYGGFIAIGEVAEWREHNIKRLHLVAGLILIALGLALVAGLL